MEGNGQVYSLDSSGKNVNGQFLSLQVEAETFVIFGSYPSIIAHISHIRKAVSSREAVNYHFSTYQQANYLSRSLFLLPWSPPVNSFLYLQ